MPKLKAKAVKALYQRRDGGAHFISSNILAAGSNFSDLNNEFFINLCGDDEFCDETPDDTDNINIEDLVDGDVAILKDLVDEGFRDTSPRAPGQHSARFCETGESTLPSLYGGLSDQS